MSEFKNVTVVKKANVYFNGGVTSRTILFASGEKKTLGIMQPGEYEFDTGKKELMEIQAGDVEVKLPGSNEWKKFSAGTGFEVPANSVFGIRALTLADYCCSFIDE